MTLATRDISLAMTPEEFESQLEAAKKKASILRRLVQDQKLSVMVGTSEHLKLEGWQTIGRAYGYSGRTSIVALIRGDGGDVEGVQAHADILDPQGTIVGGADSVCFADEDGKGNQSIAQLAGMAQTRAEGRAFKQMLSWVVVLANYSATPAEEMTGTVAKRKEAEADPRFFCALHKTAWFKKGKMRNYAHPIGETGDWCNMPQEAQGAPSEPAVVSQAQEAPPKATEGIPTNLGEALTRMEAYGIPPAMRREVLASACGITVKELGPQTDIKWAWGQFTALYEKKE